jgi:hypothetical protein
VSGANLPGPVKSLIDEFVVTVSATGMQTREAASRTWWSASCNFLKVVVFERRLPTGPEWVAIGVDAFAAASVGGIRIPVGSPPWRSLEKVKDGVSTAITNELGYVDREEAKSLADQLACAWA